MRLNIARTLAAQMRSDLLLPPPVGEERLGLAYARYVSAYTDEAIVVTKYVPFAREAYITDPHVPVAFSTRWLMNAAERAAQEDAGIFLTHVHAHYGVPWFSAIDMRTNREILMPFGSVDQSLPIGAVLQSLDRSCALLVRGHRLVALPVFEVP